MNNERLKFAVCSLIFSTKLFTSRKIKTTKSINRRCKGEDKRIKVRKCVTLDAKKF